MGPPTGTHTGVLVARRQLRRLDGIRGGLCRGHQVGSEAGVRLACRVETDLLYL